MTIKITTLFQQLEQRVEQLYAQYGKQHETKINAKFDRTLFSEDYQSFHFYFAQIKQTLTQIADLQNEETDNLHFLTHKLLSQCTALAEAVTKKNSTYNKSAVNFKPVLSAREQRKQEIHRLPPRERLTKYYEALQALNEKIDRLTDLHKHADRLQQLNYAEQLDITRQRRQRCLDAIELLEDYLAFRDGQES